MRKVIISRERKIASALLPYWIITHISKQDFMQRHGFEDDLCRHKWNSQAVSRIEISELDKIGTRIKNGETIEFAVDDYINSFLPVPWMDHFPMK